MSALPEQQATAAPATDNSTRHAVEDAVVYPSRLIYYLNRDSESPHHDLDTRVKNQAGEEQVRCTDWKLHRGIVCVGPRFGCCVVKDPSRLDFLLQAPPIEFCCTLSDKAKMALTAR